MPPPMGMRGGGGLGGGGGSRLGLPSASYTRRASTCSGSMFGPPGGPTPHKKRSIPNMDKRGSTVSASGGSALYGLVIPPKIGKVSFPIFLRSTLIIVCFVDNP